MYTYVVEEIGTFGRWEYLAGFTTADEAFDYLDYATLADYQAKVDYWEASLAKWEEEQVVRNQWVEILAHADLLDGPVKMPRQRIKPIKPVRSNVNYRVIRNDG